MCVGAWKPQFPKRETRLTAAAEKRAASIGVPFSGGALMRQIAMVILSEGVTMGGAEEWSQVW